jgi:hypothetical protein
MGLPSHPALIPCPYTELYPSEQVQLLQLWDEILLLHEKQKQLIGKLLHIIGFNVDLSTLLISFPQESKRYLVSAIRDFVDPHNSRCRTLLQWQRLLGWIKWALNV